MSQIRISSLASGLLLTLFVFTLSGCGDKNSLATFDSSTGKHVNPASWSLVPHKNAATANDEPCRECHGSDFKGGTSRVDCTTQCHLGDEKNVHPLIWGNSIDLLHAFYVTVNGTSRCGNASCHGTDLKGVASSGFSCTSCHIGDATHKHPLVGWSVSDFSIYSSHPAYVGVNTDTRCANAVCHGVNRDGAAPATGPSCSSCHLGNTGSGNNITYSVHPVIPAGRDWTFFHQDPSQYGNIPEAKCDIAPCHGDPNDRTKPFNPSIRAVVKSQGCDGLPCHGTHPL